MTNKCKGIFGWLFGHKVESLTESREYGVKSEGLPVDKIIDSIIKHPTLIGTDLTTICDTVFSAAKAVTIIPVSVYCKRCGQIDKIQELRKP